ncbi:MAG: hypothetical protein AAFX40_16195 [Cyanobacteria bacterium J06639_1]
MGHISRLKIHRLLLMSAPILVWGAGCSDTVPTATQSASVENDSVRASTSQSVSLFFESNPDALTFNDFVLVLATSQIPLAQRSAETIAAQASFLFPDSTFSNLGPLPTADNADFFTTNTGAQPEFADAVVVLAATQVPVNQRTTETIAAQSDFLFPSGNFTASEIAQDGALFLSSADPTPTPVPTPTPEPPANLLGTYTGTTTQTLSNCQDPVDDGFYSFPTTLNLNSQTGANYSGTLAGQTTIRGATVTTEGSVSGTVDASGSLTASLESTLQVNGAFDSTSTASGTGTLSGDALTFNFSGSDTSGDTCTFTGEFNGSR